MTPEGKIKAKLDRWLDEHMPGHWRVKPRGGPFGKAGCPDLLICWQGIFIAIEVKAESGGVSDLQLTQLRLILRAGGVAAVLKGFDLRRLQAIKASALSRVKEFTE